MKANIKDTHKSRLRFPYPNGKPVECPHCGEKFELKRLSETTGYFECLHQNCGKAFHVKKGNGPRKERSGTPNRGSS